jgi:hypothetical protein
MSLISEEMSATKKMMMTFSGDVAKWTEWRSVFQSYLRKTCKAEYQVLRDATKAKRDHSKLEVKNNDANIELYDTLNLLCRGVAAAVIRAMPAEDIDDGAKAWMALLDKYEVNTRTRFVNLHHRLLNAKVDLTDPDKYFHEVDFLRKQLAELSRDNQMLSDDEMISFTLYALPSEVDYLRSVLEADKNLSYEAMKVHIRSHAESRSLHRDMKVQDQAHFVSRKPKSRMVCFRCSEPGHVVADCPETKSKQKRSPCEHCGWRNHASKDCHNPGGPKHRASANTTIASEVDDNKQYAFATMQPRSQQESDWILDSACSNHMSYDKTDFTEMRKVREFEVEGAGGVILTGNRVGPVELLTVDSDGNNTTLRMNDVLYVPDLKKKLFSVKSFKRSSSHNSVHHLHEGDYIQTCDAKINMVPGGNLYKFPTQLAENVYFSSSNYEYQLWHGRLGHANPKSIGKVMAMANIQGVNLRNL